MSRQLHQNFTSMGWMLADPLWLHLPAEVCMAPITGPRRMRLHRSAPTPVNTQLTHRHVWTQCKHACSSESIIISRIHSVRPAAMSPCWGAETQAVRLQTLLFVTGCVTSGALLMSASSPVIRAPGLAHPGCSPETPQAACLINFGVHPAQPGGWEV